MKANIDKQYINILKELGVDEIHHSDSSLMSHLIGTYTLLSDWGASKDVCLGGLFHSIYGTQYFTVQATSLEDRSKVRDGIGERAEKLAYLFCTSDRKEFYSDECELMEEDIKDIVEIEAANLLEQFPRFVGKIPIERIWSALDRFEKNSSLISENALAAVTAYNKSLDRLGEK